MNTAAFSKLAHGRRRRGAAALAAVGLLALTACNQDNGAEPQPTATGSGEASTVVVGMGPTQQSRTVAEVWALALEDSGAQVEVKEVEGGRAGYLQAVEDGEIDLYPDYTGDLYLELRGTEPSPAATSTADPTATTASASPSTPGTTENLVNSLANLLGQGQQGVTDADVEAALADQLPADVQMLNPAPAENKRVLAVTSATQAKLSVNSIADLSRHCSDLTFGALTGEDQAAVTSAAVEDTYNCTPGEVKDYNSLQEVTQALLDGEIDVAGILSASPAVGDNSLKVLDDNRDALVPERVIPVAGADLPRSAVDEVNNITGRLDSDALVLLTRMTTASTPYSPEDAADYWYGTVRP